MENISDLREIRRVNTSYDAYSRVSSHREKMMTKSEIAEMARRLEAEMMYLEGYITLGEIDSYKRAQVVEAKECVCDKCGCSTVSDYVIWTDIIERETGIKTLIKFPLPRNNVVNAFKTVRKEYVDAGYPNFNSYLLKEIENDDVKLFFEASCSVLGEELKLGIICPDCGNVINHI